MFRRMIIFNIFHSEGLTVKKHRFVLLLLFFVLCLLPQRVYAESDVDRVIIVSIDSMNNDFLFNRYENPDFVHTPNMGALVRNGAAFTDAEAVMPTKTQVNHITMVSGSYAEKIGVPGNYVYDVNKTGLFFFEKYVYPWKRPGIIKADTIFQAMEREDPDYTSAVVAGKNFVGRPIWADIQVAPGYVTKTAERLGVKKFPEVQFFDAPDEWTMDNTLLVLEEADPDIMLVNLAFLDPVQHIFGHGSMEAWATLSWADHQLGRLLKYLTESGKLGGTLIVLTADHGQSNKWESVNIGRVLRTNGVRSEVVADGSFASIFLKDGGDPERAVGVLEGVEGVDGVWYGEGLDEIRIRTPYTGDIAISLRPPYEAYSRFKEPFIGVHGGLQQRFVPLIFFGPYVKRGVVMEKASLTDIVPTICEITGYPLPRDSQGGVLPVMDRSMRSAPEITYQLDDYRFYTVSYVSLIPFLLSILILIPASVIYRGYGHPWVDVTSDKVSNIVPYLLLATSVVLAMTSSFFSYIVNLYSVPGIQPDSYIVSMNYSVLGSFIVSMNVSLIIIWFSPLGVQVLLQKVRRKRIRIRTIPMTIVILTISQLIYASIHMLFHVPYTIAFHMFMLFFFGGLGVTYLFRISLIRRYVEVNRRNIILWTAISGVLNGVFWFYLQMLMLFPNYLYEIGIVSII